MSTWVNDPWRLGFVLRTAQGTRTLRNLILNQACLPNCTSAVSLIDAVNGCASGPCAQFVLQYATSGAVADSSRIRTLPCCTSFHVIKLDLPGVEPGLPLGRGASSTNAPDLTRWHQRIRTSTNWNQNPATYQLVQMPKLKHFVCQVQLYNRCTGIKSGSARCNNEAIA